jgi:predicted transcriptional regulator
MSAGDFMFKEVCFLFQIKMSSLELLVHLLKRVILYAITSLSGQVGISESGIDDAVQKLVARG